MAASSGSALPHPIRSDGDYDAAAAEIDRLLDEDPAPGTASAIRLALFARVVEAYDDEHHKLSARDRQLPLIAGPMIRIPTHRAPTHPGEMLLEEFIRPLGLTQVEFAARIGVSYPRLSEILHGKRGVTPDTAMRLEQALGMDAQFWLNLQMAWDLFHARRSPVLKAIKRIKRIKRIWPAEPAAKYQARQKKQGKGKAGRLGA